jgi:hypothetical protein
MTDAELLELYHTAVAVNPERAVVLEWVLQEWATYASPKFFDGGPPNDHEESMQKDGYANRGFWQRQILQYIDRAKIFSVGEVSVSIAPDKGRQAAMKSATTLLDSLACMIRQHGLPPAPGQTSGDLAPWET